MKAETIKVKMPIITEEELRYIDNNFEEIVDKAENVIIAKKEQITWQRLLSKQKKIIKDLKERNDKLSSQYRDRDFRCIILEQRNERAIEYLTSYESIETIQQFDHSKNNEGLDYATIDEMTRRYLEVHDKLLHILQGGGK